jgi:Ca-activated chloride channel family protein
MTFSHPWYLVLAAIGLAIFALLYRLVQRRRATQTLRYSNLQFLVGATQARRWPERIFTAAWLAALAIVLVALAGPRVHAAVPVHGSVVLCIDTSGSMTARDVFPTRAQAAQIALRAFIDRSSSGTAIGIVSFATTAQAILFPTQDRDQMHTALQAIPAANGATAIGDALSLAQRMLPKSGHRVVVLITDGENNYGVDPLSSARALGAAHIALYTIGIGTNTGALIPGTLEAAGIDEQALRDYAAVTGGAYSRAGDATELRQALALLGRSSSFTRKIVDVSLPAAIAGGVLMTLTLLAGVAVGKYP